MKLIDKFYEVNLSKLNAIDCEIIADKHAEKFGDWIKNSSIKNTDLPINVLLKMYKNMKGL